MNILRVKYVSEDGLNAIKSNLLTIYKEVILNNDKTISEALKDESLIKESSIEIVDFALDMSQPKGSEHLTDAENAMRVYNHLKCLTDSQAADERVWAAYTFSEFIDYMKYRWPAQNKEKVEYRYLFKYTKRESLLDNGIARLWWIGRITYDEKRKDPYELTKFVCKHQYLIESLRGRSYFSNHQTRNTVIKYLFDTERKGVHITPILIGDVSKYVNLLSGAYIVDMMDPEYLYSKIESKFNHGGN